jgi:hypothetical protein
MDEQSGSSVHSQQQYQNNQLSTYSFADHGQPILPMKSIHRYQQNFNPYNSNYLNSNFQYQQYQQQLYHSINGQPQNQGFGDNNTTNSPFYPQNSYQTQYQANPNYQNTENLNVSSNYHQNEFNSNLQNGHMNYYQRTDSPSRARPDETRNTNLNGTTDFANSSQMENSMYASHSNKRSSEAAVLSVPKYIKPKICKTPLIIHSASSTDVVKPRPQFATFPPGLPQDQQWLNSRQSSNNSSLSSEYVRHSFMNQQKQSLLPPIFHQAPPSAHVPPPPVYSSQTVSSTSSSISSSSPPSSSTNRRPIHSNYPLPPPLPPVQRPSSPPKVPPQLLPRVNGQFYANADSNSPRQRPPSPPTLPPPPPPQGPPQIPFHNRLTTHNLLNTILNNSLNAADKSGRVNYEQFNDSFNSSATTTHNNSVFNNTANTNNENNHPNYLGYHQLLSTPNLYTLFDRKKQPPPPYPGPGPQEKVSSFLFLYKLIRSLKILSLKYF